MSKKTRWNISDLIDLEYYLTMDEGMCNGPEGKDIHKRDRSLFLDSISPLIPVNSNTDSPGTRKIILKEWLNKRRESQASAMNSPAVHPGKDMYESSYSLLIFLFALTGLFIGGSMAFSFLAYKGTEPLNVSSYFGLFVLSQVFLLFILGLYLTVFRKIRFFRKSSIIRFLISTALIKTVSLMKTRSEKHLPADKRGGIEAAFGVIKGKNSIYGSLFPWPVFILGQIFGVFFNIGILFATILRVMGADLAFGWQSTLKLSSQAVYKGVSTVSLPWSWFVSEPVSHPTLLQIEGSRMILKDGIASLATVDLISWWPFLCFAVLFYGLIPRVVLLFFGVAIKRVALNRVSFQSIAFDRLILRLTTPIMETEGRINGTMDEHLLHAADTEDRLKQKPVPVTASGPTIPVLIPEDIYGLYAENTLEQIVNQVPGATHTAVSKTVLDASEDMDRINDLLQEHGKSLFFLMEAWQPPIKETVFYFRQLRELVGPDVRFYILLIGKPSDDSLLTRAHKDDIRVWQQKITATGDINLTVQSI